MKFNPQFETNRLLLRKAEISDWPYLLSAVSSITFPTQLPLSQLKNNEQAKAWLAARAQEWDEGMTYVWSIVCKRKRYPIGQVSLFSREDCFALAYWIHPDYWNRGYATEACKALINHLSAHGYQGKLWAGSAKWNQRSSEVLRKVGFSKLGVRIHNLDNGIAEEIEEYELELYTGAKEPR